MLRRSSISAQERMSIILIISRFKSRGTERERHRMISPQADGLFYFMHDTIHIL